jgi:murein DD-endopeptidase MepM/ murein hydrolase activator NlpD
VASEPAIAALPGAEAQELSHERAIEPRVHFVVHGESLTAIARRYGTTVQALVEENRLPDPDRLQVGQRLGLPGPPEPAPPVTGPSEPVLVGGMAWPVAGGRVLSPFGAPRAGRAHTGVDIGGNPGQAILAAEDGVVVFAGTLRGYGNTIVLDHGAGMRSLYAHNRKITVAIGDAIRRGDTIARLGRSGNATTDHCHFEVRRGEVPLDPLALVSQAEAAAAGARP